MYEPWWGKKSAEIDIDFQSKENVEHLPSKGNELTQNVGNFENELTDPNSSYNDDDKYVKLMSYQYEMESAPNLPIQFELKDPYPGEPVFMKLRHKPAVLRYHKVKQNNDAEAFWFAEAMLYLPHDEEQHLNEQISEAKSSPEAWTQFTEQINYVKSQIMEHLAENEISRLMADQLIVKNDKTGELLNPEIEQELGENIVDSYEQIPSLEHLDPEVYEGNPNKDQREKSYKSIEVRPLIILREIARDLDFNQRKILEIAIGHARNLVKLRSGPCTIPTPPLLMIDGAAGSGKSHVISMIREFVHLIMQLPGDDPEFPNIMVCEPTGSAAVNINVTTLHAAFGITFGNDHFSLPDKTRDIKRNLYKNMKFFIIDEISMVKADQLYQLDLRLREITIKSDELFGGISVLLFGDVMQLRPVMGRYIWSQPQNEDYLHAYIVQSHWERFKVISLLENHRQEEDREYANILNLIRTGDQNEVDLNMLEERVRPEQHPDLHGALMIACKHKDVRNHNDVCLANLKNDLIIIKAVNTHPNIEHFKPKIDKKKLTVGNTPYLESLHLKIGCRVMLTINLDVKDGLCNGSMGTLLSIVVNESKDVTTLLVKFDDCNAGREMRISNPQWSSKFPDCTPLKKQIHKYSTSRSLKG